MAAMIETTDKLHTLAEMCKKHLPETVNDGISISLTPSARAANSTLWHFQITVTKKGERYSVTRGFDADPLIRSRVDEFALLAKEAVQQLAPVIASAHSLEEIDYEDPLLT